MKYALNEAKIYADITDGIAILINSETGIYYGMNSFASDVYKNLTEGVSTDDILAAANNMPGVPANFADTLNEFVAKLVEKGILLEAGEGSSTASLDAAAAKESDFVLEFNEFNDAQELLLADPIHEVKEEEGWTPETSSLNPDKEDVARREAKIDR
ncbi:MAG: PqqD family protein [Bacteroidales bacterium]|nr:PqqD family protein [Bacteroidales bacterium]